MANTLLDLIAVRHGHFRLESGHHGNLWLDLDALFLRPGRLQPFVRELAGCLSRHRIEAVVGPLVGGALVAQGVAAELGALFAFAERIVEVDGVTYRIAGAFHRALAGRRVAIVDDAINAGSATRATYGALTSLGAKPIAVGALLLLGNTALPFFEEKGLAVERLAALPNEIWEPTECPLCAAGQPLSNPLAAP